MDTLLRLMLLACCLAASSIASSNALAGDAFQCPSEVCRCGLDQRGRIKVVCDRGTLGDPIPIRNMDSSTEVLVITAPEDRPNSLTIGPIFQNLAKLEELKITNSFIPAIGKHSFWGLRTLRILDLSSNNISGLVESNFRGLIALEELRLDNNIIDSITSAAFRHLSSLRRLSLTNNRLTEFVPRLFYGLHRLEELDLSDNPLQDLEPEVFRDVRLLKSFRCRRCELTYINPLLLHLLPDIVTLDLGENNFHYLEKHAFMDLKRLRNLYLDGNQIAVLTSGVFTGQNLSSLSLARNRMVTIDPAAFVNVSVFHLDLSSNRLQGLEPSVLTAINSTLARLKVGGNPFQVSHLWSSILGPRIGLNLSELDVSDIQLGPDQHFQTDFFSFIRDLQKLNLSGCALSVFPSELVRSLSNLRELDISRNKLQTLPDATLSTLSSLSGLRRIYLHSNPWHCDACLIGPLLKWLDVAPASRHIRDSCRGLKANTPSLTSISDEESQPCPVCQGPASVTGVELPRFDHVNLPPCKYPPILLDASGLPSKVRVGHESQASAEEATLNSFGHISAYFLENPIYLTLLCGVAVLFLVALCVAIAVLSRHAASYYTNEDRHKKSNHDSSTIYDESERLFLPNGLRREDVKNQPPNLGMITEKSNVKSELESLSSRNNNRQTSLDSSKSRLSTLSLTRDPRFEITSGVSSRGVMCSSSMTVYPAFEEQAQTLC